MQERLFLVSECRLVAYGPPPVVFLVKWPWYTLHVSGLVTFGRWWFVPRARWGVCHG